MGEEPLAAGVERAGAGLADLLTRLSDELHRELEASRAERWAKAGAPLDHGEPLAHQLVEAELGHFFDLGQAIEVGVHDGHTPVVLVDQGERRARHRDFRRDAEGAEDPAREKGLARAELSLEPDHVGRAQPRRERRAEMTRPAAG